MNVLLAHPAVQWLARGCAVWVVVATQWWSMDPDRFIAHVEERVERGGQSLREAVRQALAMRMIQLGAPMIFFASPELYFTLLQGAALLVFFLTAVAGGMLAQRSRPPAILKRRWMDDFDQWWNYPGMAIREHRARCDAAR